MFQKSQSRSRFGSYGLFFRWVVVASDRDVCIRHVVVVVVLLSSFWKAKWSRKKKAAATRAIYYVSETCTCGIVDGVKRTDPSPPPPSGVLNLTASNAVGSVSAIGVFVCVCVVWPVSSGVIFHTVLTKCVVYPVFDNMSPKKRYSVYIKLPLLLNWFFLTLWPAARISISFLLTTRNRKSPVNLFIFWGPRFFIRVAHKSTTY